MFGGGPGTGSGRGEFQDWGCGGRQGCWRGSMRAVWTGSSLLHGSRPGSLMASLLACLPHDIRVHL